MPSLDEIKAAVRGSATGEGVAPAAVSADDAPPDAPPDAAPKLKRGRKPRVAPLTTDTTTDDTDAPEMLSYRVALPPDNAPAVVEAFDRLDAIEKYNAERGILSTIHKHTVEEV